FVDSLKQSVNNYIDEIEIKKLEGMVQLIVREREQLQSWSERDLKLSTLAFKDDLKKGKKLDQLIVPAFSVINEVARRLLKQYPYDVQVLAGLVIHSGRVAEMKAGEGK